MAGTIKPFSSLYEYQLCRDLDGSHDSGKEVGMPSPHWGGVLLQMVIGEHFQWSYKCPGSTTPVLMSPENDNIKLEMSRGHWRVLGQTLWY